MFKKTDIIASAFTRLRKFLIVRFPLIQSQAMAFLFLDEKSDVVIGRLENFNESCINKRESKSSSKETFYTPSS